MKSTSHSDADAAGEVQDVWSSLWSKGVLHSCGSAFQGNYQGQLRLFWQQQFHTLSAGSRLVDIGTGNGAIPLLASRVLRERGVQAEIHGVDLADIDPPAHMRGDASRYAGIRFHPRTSALSLPFANASVHMLTSHYALEYMPREQVIRELVRVMAKGSTVACVLHSHDSIIARTLPSQLEALEWVLQESPLFAHTLQLLKLAPGNRKVGEPSPAPEPTRAAFTASMRDLMLRSQAQPQADVLRKTALHLRAAMEATAGRGPQHLCEAEQSLRDEHARLRQLESAILSEEDLRALHDAFAQAGRQVMLAPIDQAPGIRMGHSLVATGG